jgi:hypothetical protein
MAPTRIARDRRAIAMRGSPRTPLDGVAFVVRPDATAREPRGVPGRAGSSPGYGVWQKPQTRTLLLSFPQLGQSI